MTHFSLDERARLRNALELNRVMQLYPRPHILVGDFNDVFDSLTIQFLTGRTELYGQRGNLIDSWYHYHYWLHQRDQNQKRNLTNNAIDKIREEERQSWTFTTLNNSDKRRIDYIFNSNELFVVNSFILSKNCIEMKNKKLVCASDHAPVITDFQYIQF